MVEFHLVAGLLALLAGFIALFAPKGRYLHRRSGRVFVGAMTAMLGTAAILALFGANKSGNWLGALLTLYLVLTSLLTVTRRVDQVRGITAGLAVVAFVLGGLAFAGGVDGMRRPTGELDSGAPAGGAFLFALIATGCAIQDVRMLARGSIDGAQRLIRHLWRMTFALWVATASFFLGQAKVLPEPLRNFALLSIPVLAVLLMLFYWLGRVATRKTRAI